MPGGIGTWSIGRMSASPEDNVARFTRMRNGDKAVSRDAEQTDSRCIHTEFRPFRVYRGDYGVRNSFTDSRDTPAIRDPKR